MLLDESISDASMHAAVFAIVGRTALSNFVEQVNLLARPSDDSYFAEPRQQTGTIRYLPRMLAGLDLAAALERQLLFDAVDHLRCVRMGEKWRGPVPMAVVPKACAGQLGMDDGAFDKTEYLLCALDRLRRTIRRRDVFSVCSLCCADPRKALLTGTPWQAARPTMCRTIGVAVAAEEEIVKLSAQLDLA